MIRELPYFTIGDSYGSNQDWLTDPIMKLGGCGAVTACDLCIYLAKYYGAKSLVPFDVDKLDKKTYIAFAQKMKSYLHPRWKGINTLEAWMDSFQRYLDDCAEASGQSPIAGMRPVHKEILWPDAGKAITAQIDAGMPLPTMILHHQDKRFEDYEWHWFLLNGYTRTDDGHILVKAVTYSEARWLPLDKLWLTGRDLEDGGVVLLDRSASFAHAVTA